MRQLTRPRWRTKARMFDRMPYGMISPCVTSDLVLIYNHQESLLPSCSCKGSELCWGKFYVWKGNGEIIWVSAVWSNSNLSLFLMISTICSGIITGIGSDPSQTQPVCLLLPTVFYHTKFHVNFQILGLVFTQETFSPPSYYQYLNGNWIRTVVIWAWPDLIINTVSHLSACLGDTSLSEGSRCRAMGYGCIFWQKYLYFTKA